MRIALDAMGGDAAPQATVDGAVAAARELGVAVLLVGDRARIEPELARHKTAGLDIEVRHASETVAMDEAPTAALRKPDSSMWVGLSATRYGDAAAFVFAGNTGAGMVLGAHLLGRTAGVERPAIAVLVPTPRGHTILLDAGANVDCRPIHLTQFAVMGDAYARAVRQIPAPRIGLLSNGLEESKGNALVRAAAPLLRQLPINFVGYVEGRDVNSGTTDVVVCDGFVGNLVLKSLEGFGKMIGDRLRAIFEKNLFMPYQEKPPVVTATTKPSAATTSTVQTRPQPPVDPRRGAAMAVCEAARNVACAGGRPAGLTDCLNFGSPERPEILWQFAEAVEGIAEACRALELPVVGGNVSFYNETSGQAILPTPIIGVVGVLEDAGRLATQAFKGSGHRVALLGPEAVSLGGSEYLWTLHGRVAGTLAPLDLGLERRVQAAVVAAIEAGLALSAHDCAEGGLAVALAEACMTGPEAVGATVTVPGAARTDVVLFGEGPSRVIVSVDPARALEFEALMAESAIPWRWIGTTGGERLRIRRGGVTVVDSALDGLEQAWRRGLERHLA